MIRRLTELSISSVAPDRVLVSIDGPRNETETGIWRDFDFSILKKEFPFSLEFIRRPENLGCSLHIITAVSEVLQIFESVIVIEDDVVVGNGFLQAMTNGLSIISSDGSIGTVGGFSPFRRGLFPSSNNYWRKSAYFSAWGWGTTKNFWDSFVSLTTIENPGKVLESSSVWMNFSERKKRIWLRRFHRGIWDYNVQFMLFLKDQKSLLPRLRLIDNEGFSDSRSTHTRHRRPWNLFGQGLCSKEPQNLVESSFFSIRNFMWSWIDSNLWAADGYFNSRAREMGIRSLFRKLLWF
jgi:hypothetical protein